MSQSKSQFSLSFKESIHKVYVDKDWAAIEIRKSTVKEAEFYLWNFTTDLLQQIIPEELVSWQTTLVGLKDGVGLLSYFPNETLPGTDWLLAFDGQTGDNLWQNFQCRFRGFSNQGVVIKNIKDLNNTDQTLDLRTGELLLNATVGVTFSNHEGAVFPEISTEDLNHLIEQSDYTLKENTRLELITHNDRTVLGAYFMEHDITNHRLLVFNQGKLTEDFLLASKIKGYGFDPFFIFENKLIFIEEKSRLIIKELIK